MGLEVDKPDFSPKDLNANWPLGAENLSQGDNHIRLTKKAMKNFFDLYEIYTVKNENRFDNDKAKEALFAENSNKLGGHTYDMFAFRIGTYPDLRAQATTKDDVELGKVDNFPTASKIENNSQKFTPVSLLFQLKNELDETIENNKTLKEFVRFEKLWRHQASQGSVEQTLLTYRIKDPKKHGVSFMLPAGTVVLNAAVGAGVAGASGTLEFWIYANGDRRNPLFYRKITARVGLSKDQGAAVSATVPTSYAFELTPGKVNVVEFVVKKTFSLFPGDASADINIAGMAEMFIDSNIVTTVG